MYPAAKQELKGLTRGLAPLPWSSPRPCSSSSQGAGVRYAIDIDKGATVVTSRKRPDRRSFVNRDALGGTERITRTVAIR